MKAVLIALSVMLVACVTAVSPKPAQAQNLLRNGDFAEGSALKPDGWSAESWVPRPTTAFSWIAPQDGEPGSVEISCTEKDDARWSQSLKIGPGPATYFVGAEIRTEDVDEQMGGAFVSLGDEGIASADVSGTVGWRRVGFLVRIPAKIYDIDVKLRLGGMLNFTTGRAFFRNARVFLVQGRIPRTAMVYDLQLAREAWSGRRWTIPVIFLALILGSVAGWRMLE